MKEPVISVVGLGKLGLPMAACLASGGFQVIGVDADSTKIDAVIKGEPTIFEPGLSELLQSVGDRLSATIDTAEAVIQSEVTFIVVPTPSDSEGGFSLRYVEAACKEIGQALRVKKSFHVIVLTSTVMPGATESAVKLVLEQSSGKECGRDFGLCYSPEFIALGSVIQDFLNPDFLLIGESDARSSEILEMVYKNVCNNDPEIARMTFINAELAKLAVNTFVTTKITFANMIARICEQLPNADVDIVTSAIGLDSRIGKKYLKGAIGYGGPCFPRDNVALTAIGNQVGASVLLAEATDTANRQEVRRLADLVISKLTVSGSVGILGLSYKPNTDVVEESQGLLLAQELIDRGVSTVVYDPAALPEATRILDERVRIADSASACCEGSDVIVITTPWEEFKNLPVKSLMREGLPRVLVDCWRILEPAEIASIVDYVPLGRWITT
jgi:UDPglucose 6-dehydrogenase